jgi:hypothetical protein
MTDTQSWILLVEVGIIAFVLFIQWIGKRP